MKISEKSLKELMLSTGTYKETDSQEDKDKWHKIYRKVEEESITQINLAGGIEKWYESGQGRLI